MNKNSTGKSYVRRFNRVTTRTLARQKAPTQATRSVEPKDTPRNVAIYQWIGLADDAKLKAQRELCLKYVSQNFPSAVPTVYSDCGHTRTAREALLDAAAKGTVDAVVVEDIDRLSRNFPELLKICRSLESCTTTIYSAHAGQVDMQIMAAFSLMRAEVGRIHGQRVRAGHARNAALRKAAIEK